MRPPSTPEPSDERPLPLLAGSKKDSTADSTRLTVEAMSSPTREAAVSLTGEFNENALSFKPDNDALVSDFKASARKVCIFFKPAI